MALIDVPAIQKKKQQIADRKRAGVEWCVEALGEMRDAFVAVDTPVSQKLEEGKYGAPTGAGLWAILRADSDHYGVSVKFGALIDDSGSLFRGEKPADAETVAKWIAIRCDYQPEIMGRMFEAALLGEAWSESTALKQW